MMTKVIDTSFIIVTMITRNPDAEDVEKYFRALRRAQRDIDLRPDPHTHYYKREFSGRFHYMMDTRRWGPAERLVFGPYTKEAFERSFAWVREHEIFENGKMGSGIYEEATALGTAVGRT